MDDKMYFLQNKTENNERGNICFFVAPNILLFKKYADFNIYELT